MVMGNGLIKLILIVQLWKFCLTRLIENESFFRTSRVNNVKEQLNSDQPTPKDVDSSEEKFNFTETNDELLAELRTYRKLDDDDFFYLKPKNDNKSNFTKSGHYINYQQAYGIRFNPNKIRRSFSYKDKENDDLSPDNEMFIEVTTISSGFYGLNSNPDNIDVIKEFDNSSLLTPFSQIHKSNLTNDLIISKSYNLTKPSKIETTLQNFNSQLKKLFSLGTDGIRKPNPNSQRFLNVFNVVKFQNIPCATSNSPLTQLNGTCYHQFECDRLGGIAMDTCAEGFGVCCIFQFGCGGMTNQTVSYFKNPDFPEATKTRLICTFTIELWPNVNQVLLQFLFFELMAPVGGSCVDDQFIVAGQSSNNLIPILCGVNSGQHIYIDVESSQDRKLYLSVLAASPNARAFNIRISQILNGFEQAPQNCLQYYQDVSGVVQTFNYDDASVIVETRQPSYFNNLNYAICIKRFPEYCTTRYTNVIGDIEQSFQLINVDQDGVSVIPAAQAGAEIYNCADDFISVNGIRLCGEKLNDGSVTDDFTANAPVTDYSAGPIIIPVRTNDAVVGRGFKLIYFQQTCQDVT